MAAVQNQMNCCPLCEASDASEIILETQLKWGYRRYIRCMQCDLIFMPSRYHLDSEEEKQRYLLHDNDVYDPDYRKFLQQLMKPLLPCLRRDNVGLDFGAGPGPALVHMFREAGFKMEIYDPHFAPDSEVLERRYDFITCTEVVEHFNRPGIEFQRLNGLLEPGGWLGVMTLLWNDAQSFGDWHYYKDPTHVCFFHLKTMNWIAKHYGWKLSVISERTVLFHKPLFSKFVGDERNDGAKYFSEVDHRSHTNGDEKLQH